MVAKAIGADSRQSMKSTTTIMIGAPLTGEEARFLRVLEHDISGTESLILASFEAGARQIDFVVVTPSCAALVELKNFRLPIFGQQNGDWDYETPAGDRRPRSGENPWQQAARDKYALSDEMTNYQRHSNAPAPLDGKYFKQVEAFVCVYPRIHPRSQVPRGNKKVVVASYADVIAAIRSKTVSSSWSIQDWKGFAETHLRLKTSTLAAATDRNVDEATEQVRAYNSRLETLISVGLPPLPQAPDDTSQGQGLIDSLLEPTNFMLVGPSGSAKTFHLQHLALAASAKGEVLPLLLEAKKYRRDDFWGLLRHGTGPLFQGDPKELLRSMTLCGLRPVLMLDALNECAADLIQDLLRDIQAFALRYRARIVVTCQSRIELPGVIRSTKKELALPDAQQKRSIYAYHSGLAPDAELDYFCAGFTNAYDLTIAGRCHNADAKIKSRSDLYDRYIRRCLPGHTVVQSALLRAIAGEMADRVTLAWDRDKFDRTAERFVQSQGASLLVLDDLYNSRLVDLTDEHFSFEHELLFDYFRAEELRRRFTDVSDLTSELTRPRNQDLLEFIVPRFSDEAEIATLMTAAADQAVLCRIIEGKCGATAQSVLVRQCEVLLDDAGQDLQDIRVTCASVKTDDRRKLTALPISGNREWTEYEVLLCKVIALNLDHPNIERKFLELLDLTEAVLRSAVSNAATDSRFDPDRVWGEAVRLYGGVVGHGTMQLPYLTIVSAVRNAQMRNRSSAQGLGRRAQLFKRVPKSHFAMLTLIGDLEHYEGAHDVDSSLNLVRQAWDTGIYIIRTESMHLLQSMRRQIRATEELQLVHRLLQGFETDNMFVNTVLFETMALYGCLEPPVSFEAALSEMRALIAPGAGQDAAAVEIANTYGSSPGDFLASLAYGQLSKLFEDVFLDAYYEAYSALSDEEKCDILCLAAKAPDAGFTTDWILQELRRFGGARALPIYQHFASRIETDTPFTQGAVSCFLISIEGLARLTDVPPSYQGGGSPEHRAWEIMGEILFRHSRAGAGEDQTNRIRNLWARLTGPVALAAGDVLYQIKNASWRFQDRDSLGLMIPAFSPEVQQILMQCIGHKDSLPSIFSHGGSSNRDLLPFLVETLGRIGDAAAIPTLQAIAEERNVGKAAILAIQAIQKRSMSVEAHV